MSMTRANLTFWFAGRGPQPVPKRLILSRLGDVRWQLKSLVEIGVLNAWFDYDKYEWFYSLNNWKFYQPRSAA
jgi:hypothetical protein